MVKIIRRIIDIIFVAIIAILVGYFILRLMGKTAIFNVQTGSMETGIHVGDYILTYKTNHYEVGDIVTYKYEKVYVTHRIIQKKDDKIITKGDANNVEDEEIDLKDIKGKVIYSGGVLNIIINFKYAIVAFMLAIYLLSCYLGDDKDEKSEEKSKIKNNE
jgi:signal peptidase